MDKLIEAAAPELLEALLDSHFELKAIGLYHMSDRYKRVEELLKRVGVDTHKEWSDRL